MLGCTSGSDSGQSPIRFLDSPPANVSSDEALGQFVFQDLEGHDRALDEYAKGKSIVVVITRGNTAHVCPYCSTQVARLIRDYPQISKLNAEVVEVVVVYPIEDVGDKGQLDKLLNNSRAELKDPKRQVPFPILLDAAYAKICPNQQPTS